MLADCTAHSAALPRLALLYDLPLLLSSAAALPVLWQCAVIPVYQGTPQCGERSNAAFGRQSAAVLPSLAPHDSKARLIVVTTRRDSWRSHVHRTHTAQRVQLFKLQTANVGGRGGLPSPFSGGFKGGILFGKRIPPLVPRRTRRSPLPRKRGNKEQPFRAATFPRPGRESCPNCQYGILIPIFSLFLWIICGIDFWRFRG